MWDWGSYVWRQEIGLDPIPKLLNSNRFFITNRETVSYELIYISYELKTGFLRTVFLFFRTENPFLPNRILSYLTPRPLLEERELEQW